MAERNSEKLVSDVSRRFLYRRCNDCTNDVIGRILTITDAAAQDEVQRKALKDLVTATIWVGVHSLEKDIGYFCDDLAAKLSEQIGPRPPSEGIQRASIFE